MGFEGGYEVWDFLVNCFITGRLLDSSWLSLLLIYLSQLNLINNFPMVYGTFGSK